MRHKGRHILLMFRKCTVYTLIFTCLTVSVAVLPSSAASNEPAPSLSEYEDILSSYVEVQKYVDYFDIYKTAPCPEEQYVIDAGEFIKTGGMQEESLSNFDGMPGISVLTDEVGFIEWEVTIEKSGFYNMNVLYYPIEGNSSNIQRSIFIDGILPYSETALVEFDRLWKSQNKTFKTDNRGNELRPVQIEAPEWMNAQVRDSQRYNLEPLKFYLEQGEHTITFVSRREPMLIRSITLYNTDEIPTYSEIKEQYKKNKYRSPTENMIPISAEHATLVSSPMLAPLTDRSGPMVTPYDVELVVLNSIGGKNWSAAGQWIEWEIEVPEDGLYQIGMNVKQNWVLNGSVTRKLTIDGKVPFREADKIEFAYKSGWRQQVLGDDEPYQFYFAKGTHRIRLEAILGDLAPLIQEIEESVVNLSTIYKRIIMLTGNNIDRWRDYQLERNIPGLRENLLVEYERILEITAQIRKITGRISAKDAILVTLRDQLKLFIDNLEKIPIRKDSFKTNIGALAAWLIQSKELPLMIDEIYIISGDAEMPKLKDSIFNKIVHEIKSLAYSFIIDYNTIGNVVEDSSTKNITVWVGTGRDQANTMKDLIDESFTVETGIGVNLMIVPMDSLLPATLAGQGPDVAMMVGNDLPMNYALRGAVADLTQFDDFSEIASRFRESAMVPFTFEDKVFALPETQTFNMMFYRKDIMKELGLDIPQTWDDVKTIMSAFSKYNMEFGMMPIPSVLSGGTTFGSSNSAPTQTDIMFGMFLYQSGGEFYKNDGRESDLDSDIAVNAFKVWTQYYTDYTLTREFDFQTRFRIGEMPVGIADYSMYNLLQVAAPEIKGLWGFTQVPGTVREDGTIDRTVPSSGSATVIINTTKDTGSSWEYLKWWTHAKIQSAFGRRMEALQGPAARYPTANIEALSSLPWPVEDYKNLSQQFENVRGIPQVPGGYYTARNVTNAFTTVVIDKKSGPREALMDNVRYINDEIWNKRQEFGLD